MFLRCSIRKKDGKEHRYWSIVENKRCAGNKIAQRHVLYLGEINDQQEANWRRTIDLCEHGQAPPRTVALFSDDRIWVMDRGIPTEATLEQMRQSDPPAHYLVGTPKGRLSQLEEKLLALPWQKARAAVEVKLLEQEGETCVLAKSLDRVSKERAMRRRQLKGLWQRLKELAGMELKRDALLLKLGAAKQQAPFGLAAGGAPAARPGAEIWLHAAQRQVARRAPAGGPVFAAQQPDGQNPGAVMGILFATGAG